MSNSTIHENKKNLVVFGPITREKFYRKDRPRRTWPERFPGLVGTNALDFVETREEYEIDFDDALQALAAEQLIHSGHDFFTLCSIQDPQDPTYIVSLVGCRTPDPGKVLYGIWDQDKNMQVLRGGVEDIFRIWSVLRSPELQALNKVHLPDELDTPIRKKKSKKKEPTPERILRVAHFDQKLSISLQAYFLQNRKKLYEELTTELFDLIYESQGTSSLREKNSFTPKTR